MTSGRLLVLGRPRHLVLLCLTGTPWVPLQQQLHLEQLWHSSSLALGTGHGTVMTDSLINWVDILTVMNALKSD